MGYVSKLKTVPADIQAILTVIGRRKWIDKEALEDTRIDLSRTNLQGADLLFGNGPGRNAGHLGDDLLQRQAKLQKFTGSGGQIKDRTVNVVVVQIAGDGLGQKVLGQGGFGDIPTEAARAVPNVKNNAPLDCVPGCVTDPVLVIEQPTAVGTVKTVG